MDVSEIRQLVDDEPQRGGGTGSQLFYLAATQALDRALRPAGGLAGAPGGSEVILLVEDEDAIRVLVRKILETKGYAVCEARNGREGLALCGAHEGPIDLLLSDVVMPELGGRELADGALRMRPGMRIMFMSGYNEDSVLQERVRNGIAFLQKPFTPSALALKVREALDSGSIPRPGQF
ncbi:MAG: response regulator [Bryobacteraceae bacterium]|jgi:CheY-like chemotaxis protein